MALFVADTHALVWYLSGAPQLRQAPGFHLTSLAPEVALKIADLAILPDIHDRLIVAEAMQSAASLLTRDQAITQAQLVATVW